MRNMAIVVIAIFLLTALYRWNTRQAAENAEEAVEVDGGQRLCEVRAVQNGLSGECELVDDRWVPVDSDSE